MVAPPPLVVRFNPAAHVRQVALILFFVVASAAAPFLLNDPTRAQLRFYGVIIILLLIWALVVARRTRDRDPQIVVDTHGLFVRSWHLGTVPWADIALVASASALRQPLSTRVFRRRLGDHLVVRLVKYPPFQTSARAPLSWFQWLAHHLDNSDPIISAIQLDVPLAQIMSAIDDQIAYRKEP